MFYKIIILSFCYYYIHAKTLSFSFDEVIEAGEHPLDIYCLDDELESDFSNFVYVEGRITWSCTYEPYVDKCLEIDPMIGIWDGGGNGIQIGGHNMLFSTVDNAQVPNNISEDAKIVASYNIDENVNTAFSQFIGQDVVFRNGTWTVCIGYGYSGNLRMQYTIEMDIIESRSEPGTVVHSGHKDDDRHESVIVILWLVTFIICTILFMLIFCYRHYNEDKTEEKISPVLDADEEQRKLRAAAEIEARRKRDALDAEEKRKKEEEERKRKEEEEERKRKQAEEDERKRREAEEAEKRRKEAELEALRKARQARIDALNRIEDTMKHEIEFVKNEAGVTEDGQHTCQEIANILLEYPELHIHIDSHTSCSQTDKFNCDEGCRMSELSQKRADNIRTLLVSAGCKNKFDTKGWGCKHPEIGSSRQVRVYPEDLDYENPV